MFYIAHKKVEQKLVWYKLLDGISDAFRSTSDMQEAAGMPIEYPSMIAEKLY